MIKKSNTLPIGYRLHHYRVEAVLGAGGFGITYMAVHEALRSRVAIKEYFPVEWSYRDRDEVSVVANTQGGLPTSEAGEEPYYAWGLQRFLQEAQVLAQVNHFGVVRVKDFFEANGTAYIVMDYEDGEPLSRLLQREKVLSEERIRQLLNDVLPALESVHSLGYLHRDLKPANLYCRSDGRTILIDFGAARQALSKRSRNITSVFTVGYSPIEQYLVESKGYGPWTDIYAVGAVLYQCVTGKQPIEAPARVLDDPLKPAVEAAEGAYSRELLKLIDRAMAIRPEQRFQTIAEMRDALMPAPFEEDETTVKLELPAKVDSATRSDGLSPGLQSAPVAEGEVAYGKKPAWLDWRWGVGLLALLAVAVGVIKIPSGSEEAPNPPTSTVSPPLPPVERSTTIATPIGPPANPHVGQTYTDALTGMELAWIVPGCFTMGSPETERDRSANETPHQVCPKGFWIGKYEVTNAQYHRFNANYDSGAYAPHALNGADQPVVRVSWKEAVDFATWMSAKTGLRYRLPTEAEWEYAARGGKESARYWDNDPAQTCRYANTYDETARKTNPFTWANSPCEDGQVVAAPVGKFLANSFGLYDMLGNVAEWTCSEYDNAYSGGETRCAEQGAASGGRRVLRGGSWSDYPGLVRFAYRFPTAPEYRKFDLGFRLVLEP